MFVCVMLYKSVDTWLLFNTFLITHTRMDKEKGRNDENLWQQQYQITMICYLTSWCFECSKKKLDKIKNVTWQHDDKCEINNVYIRKNSVSKKIQYLFSFRFSFSQSPKPHHDDLTGNLIFIIYFMVENANIKLILNIHKHTHTSDDNIVVYICCTCDRSTINIVFITYLSNFLFHYYILFNVEHDFFLCEYNSIEMTTIFLLAWFISFCSR